MTTDTFPFGAPSPRRPPRPPTGGDPSAFVLGVYPSALHVRWELPVWARELTGHERVASLAVDIEPHVFWDGVNPNPGELVDAWAAEYFRGGDGDGELGRVSPGLNGTSGRALDETILAPMGRTLTDVWLTDAVNRFFIKSGSGGRRQQADVITEIYRPVAEAGGLPESTLPARPSPDDLVESAVSEEEPRLLGEWSAAAAPILITIGEEARRVAAGLADGASGPPTRPLAADDSDYGRPGRITLNGHTADWMALTHPGNRSSRWSTVRQDWETWMSEQHGDKA